MNAIMNGLLVFSLMTTLSGVLASTSIQQGISPNDFLKREYSLIKPYGGSKTLSNFNLLT
jgi:hypothetical protein